MVPIPDTTQTKLISVQSMSECLQHCLSDCICLAFDMCAKNTQCVLRSYAYSEEELMFSPQGCSHFIIKKVTYYYNY